MDFDTKRDLLEDARDILKKIQDALAQEGKLSDAMTAQNIRYKILDLQGSIMADEYYGDKDKEE